MTQTKAIIIGAIIGATATIISALITSFFLSKPKTAEIRLIDFETKKEIPGNVFIDASKDEVISIPGQPAVIELKRKNRSIRVESEGYKYEVIPTENIASPRTIALKPISVSYNTALTPLPMIGFDSWSNGNGRITITTGALSNECIVNSDGKISNTAGFTHTGLRILSGKTLILQFANTAESIFSKSRMVKLGKSDETALIPTNSILIENEYLPAMDTPSGDDIEYPIPDNFDGNLAFVFYQADLNNLRITAYYK
jgi:hypothetical protein